YVIHMIGAKYYSKYYIQAFELFLHLLRHIQYLTIVVTDIGINMNTNMGISRKCYHIKVCKRCMERNQHLNVEFYSMSYYHYVRSRLYERPNVIIGLGIDFKDSSIWPEMILNLREQNCPLFLTSTSKLEVEKCIGKLYTVLNTILTPLYLGENRFHSLAPCGSFGSDNVVYNNKYLVI
ncbi:hypothetical protein EAI_13645, partial [Harpegnathos saltator]